MGDGDTYVDRVILIGAAADEDEGLLRGCFGGRPHGRLGGEGVSCVFNRDEEMVFLAEALFRAAFLLRIVRDVTTIAMSFELQYVCLGTVKGFVQQNKV